MFRILAVEDDAALQALLVRALRKGGFQAVPAGDGAAALALHREQPADLIVLDLMLPVLDGFQVLQALRPADEVPVIMLTALGQEHQRLRGFELGADDYLVKPFSTAELLARIRAILRRSERGSYRRLLRSGPFLLDRTAKTLLRDGHPLPLTPVEFHLLEVLLEHAGQSLTRTELLHLAWPTHARPAVSTVKVHVANLRRKLHQDGEPAWILSFGAHGYGWGASVQRSDV